MHVGTRGYTWLMCSQAFVAVRGLIPRVELRRLHCMLWCEWTKPPRCLGGGVVRGKIPRHLYVGLRRADSKPTRRGRRGTEISTQSLVYFSLLS